MTTTVVLLLIRASSPDYVNLTLNSLKLAAECILYIRGSEWLIKKHSSPIRIPGLALKKATTQKIASFDASLSSHAGEKKIRGIEELKIELTLL